LVPFHWRAERLTTYAVFADSRFALIEISFLAHRIPAAIARQINVAIGSHPPPDFLARLVVALFGRTDEIVIGPAQHLDHGTEDGAVLVGQLLRRNTFLV